MRKVEIDPVRTALLKPVAIQPAKPHACIAWSDYAANCSKTKILQEIATLYPAIDLQHLRSLRRAALKGTGAEQAAPQFQGDLPVAERGRSANLNQAIR